MNLADYSKLDSQPKANGDFIGFERTGDTKYLRFRYTSGGATIGSDIEVRKKKWDDEAHKYVYDTDDGTPTCVLNCIEYDEGGSNPRLVRWERSAYFCNTVLLPMFRNYPRIIDGVWKVTATNPKTRDASYSLFPVMDADTIKYPIIESEPTRGTDSSAPSSAPVAEAPAAPAVKKKYWEE